MGMIAFWATHSLNIPDFSRSGAGQRAQIRGQSLGLPTTMTLFALLSVLVTSGSQAVYGEAIWDPVQLVARTDDVFGLLYALVPVLVATISVNIAANVVSPAYDLAGLAPKFVNFRTWALDHGCRRRRDPFLRPLADYGWAVSLVSSLVLYVVLTGRERVTPGSSSGPAAR